MFIQGFILGLLLLRRDLPSSRKYHGVVKYHPRLKAAAASDNGAYKHINLHVYIQLIDWLQRTFPATAYVNPSIAIDESPSIKGSKGVIAKYGTIMTDELILCIPREACLTAETVLNDSDCGNIFQDLIKKAGPGGFTVAFAGYLAKEYLISRYNIQDGSIYKKLYLESLPWDSTNQGHILFWSDQLIEQSLTGSLCYEEALGLRKEVELARNLLTSILHPILLKASTKNRASPISILFGSQTKNNVFTDKDIIRGAITAAFVILLSRSFEDDSCQEMLQFERPERLIPILDMMNHNATPSITYASNNVTGVVEVRACKNIVQGEELFNCYREMNLSTMPYHRFFTRFGFVPGLKSSEDILLALKNKDPIFFP